MESAAVPEAETFGSPPRYPIGSVDNALRLLSLFHTDQRIRVKDAAETLGVATGTAHRLLSMLQYRGYVTQDPLTKVYVPGPMLVSIGLSAVQRDDLRAVAGPIMERLRDTFDETVQLATLHGSQVLFVDAAESRKTLKVTSRAGTFRPAHCTSAGKALLAELEREQVIELYPADGALPPCTGHSVATVSELLVELAAVRERGVAFNFGELEEGIGSAAAVLRGPREQALGAIGVGAPLARIDDLRMRELADGVVAAAAEISATLAS